MHLVKPLAPSQEEETGHITPEMEADFEALTSGKYDNFELVSCFSNGNPTVAIAVVEKDRITPLFVAITSATILIDHDGNELDHAEPENDEDEDQNNDENEEDDENYND